MDSNASSVKANSQFMQRYASMLAYRIAGYVSPEAIERTRKFNTSQKIAYIQEIRKLLESSNVIKSRLYQFKDADPTFNILRKIYQFLYQDNNEFSQKSYLYLLTQIADLERNGQDCAGQKKDLEELEDAFLAKISRETLKYETILKRSPAKDHILSLLRIKKSHLLGSLAVLILALTMFSAEFSRQKMEEKPHTQISRNAQNPLINAAKFLKLADTCSAYAFIKQLENMPRPVKVMLGFTPESFTREGFNADSTQYSNDLDSTEYRFEQFIDMAVNYTYIQYNKITGKDIKFADTVYVDIEDKADHTLGTYLTGTRWIILNNHYLPFENNDANVFAMFAVLCHETIHQLVNENDPYKSQKNLIQKELMYYKDKKLFPPIEKVDRYKSIMLDFEKYTEIEAHKFGNMVFGKLFTGILTSMDSIKFVDSYIENVLKMPKEDAVFGSLNPDIQEIYHNLDVIKSIFPDIKGRLEEIYSGEYNDIQKKIEEDCEQMLAGNFRSLFYM